MDDSNLLMAQAEKVWNDLASRLAIVEMDCEKADQQKLGQLPFPMSCREAVMMADPVVKAADVSRQDRIELGIEKVKAKL